MKFEAWSDIGDMKCTKIKSWGKLGNLQRVQKQNQKKKKKKKKKKNDQWKENSILEKSFILKKQETNLEGF